MGLRTLATLGLIISMVYVGSAEGADDCTCNTIEVHCSAAQVGNHCGPGAGACVDRKQAESVGTKHCPVYLTEANCEALGLREGLTSTQALRGAIFSPDLGLHCRENFLNPLRLIREDLRNASNCCVVAHELAHVFSSSCLQSGVAAACEEVSAEGIESRCTKDITEDWCSRAIASGEAQFIDLCAMWCVNTVQAAAVLENDRCVCDSGTRSPPLSEAHCEACAGICRQFGQDNMPRVCLSQTIMNRNVSIPQQGLTPPQSIRVSQLYQEVNTYVCTALSTGQFSHSCPSYLPLPQLIVDPLPAPPSIDEPAPTAPPAPCDSARGTICPSKYPAPTIDLITPPESCAPVLKWKPKQTSGFSAPWYKTWFAEITRSSAGSVNPVPNTVRQEIVRFPGKRPGPLHTDIGDEPGKQYRKLQSGKTYRLAVASCADRACTPSGMSAWTMRDFSTDAGLTTRCTPPVPKSTLTVIKTGQGTVTSTPAAIACGTACRAELPKTTEVSLSATPSAGYTFSGWSGGCQGTGACVIRMNENRTVNAQFAMLPARYTLSVTVNGGGTVVSGGREIDCPGRSCTAGFARDAVVTLRASASTATRFVGWSPGCAVVGADGLSCVVRMSEARNIGATFEPLPTSRTITVVKSGTGVGTVASVPAGINCGSICSANFSASSPVTLTALAAPGSVFTGWDGGTGTCVGTGSCIVTGAQARIVVARFARR